MRDLHNSIAPNQENARTLSRQVPGRIVSVYAVTRGDAREIIAGWIRFDDLRGQFHDGEYCATRHSSYRDGEPVPMLDEERWTAIA